MHGSTSSMRCASLSEHRARVSRVNTLRSCNSRCSSRPAHLLARAQQQPDAPPPPQPQQQLLALPRRAVVLSLGVAALVAGQAPLALSAPVVRDGVGKAAVVTGANAGLGYDAALKLSQRGFAVTLACRTLARAEAAAAAMRADNASGFELQLLPAECDLSSLASVRAFAAAAPKPLHVLLLNAGLQRSGDSEVHHTVDGCGSAATTKQRRFLACFSHSTFHGAPPRFEETIGVNHLGHFLLTNLLLPDVVAAGDGGRIVVVSSEVHDPASPGGKVRRDCTDSLFHCF